MIKKGNKETEERCIETQREADVEDRDMHKKYRIYIYSKS